MLGMDFVVTALVMSWYHISPLAAYLMVPYVCWIFMLTYLSYYLYIFNPSHAEYGATKDEIIRQHNASRPHSSESSLDLDRSSDVADTCDADEPCGCNADSASQALRSKQD